MLEKRVGIYIHIQLCVRKKGERVGFSGGGGGNNV